MVALALWQRALTEQSRVWLAQKMQLPVEEAGQVIAYWTALHDIGKSAPTFQTRCSAARGRLALLGLDFPSIAPVKVCHHSLISAWILKSAPDWTGLPPGKARINLLMTIAGHHGLYPTFAMFNERTYQAENLGNERWQAARQQLQAELQGLFHPPQHIPLRLHGADSNAFFGILSGFFVASDWLASDTRFFSYVTEIDNPADYAKLAWQRANAALDQSGWTGWQPDQAQVAFEVLFPFSPSLIQLEGIRWANQAGDPFLMIVEAATGSGKTEMALYASAEAIRRFGLRGCYVAMPTQATSNQMFERVCDFLEKRYPGQLMNTLLAHGNALLNKDFEKLQVQSVGDEETDFSGVRALGWFLPRKRSLLAPFAVGTVDQTFLGVLQARHFFLRVFGLHRKVVIFDEVHAYDVYMVTIFQHLLAWLRACGTSVIILSATLPENTRRALLQAYASDAQIESIRSEFPRASMNERGKIYTHCLGAVDSRSVALEPLERDPAKVLDRLEAALSAGGCAAVICNTVDRAQAVFQTIRDSGRFNPEDLTLFHARFPYCWREAREKTILQKYGKCKLEQSIPRRGVVVATQVIEQSLDLDFDLLITDLAPVDLLIQRIGRLHRHSGAKHPPVRSPGLAEPRCVVALPPQQPDALARFDRADCLIYDEAILQRSFFALLGIHSLWLPADSDRLIEVVYTDADIPGLSDEQNEALRRLHQQMAHAKEEQAKQAKNRMIADVDYGDLFGNQQISLEEDDPRVHQDLQALTRETRPTVQLVCLREDAAGQTRLLDGELPFRLDHPPQGAALKAALRSVVTVSRREVVDHFLHQTKLAAWQKCAPLRFAFPVIFKDNVCRLNDSLWLTLNEVLGLQIGKGENPS
jgi:CRISPR-associated endonuclease/helicase Cas3